jgi:hypothetical protein
MFSVRAVAHMATWVPNPLQILQHVCCTTHKDHGDSLTYELKSGSFVALFWADVKIGLSSDTHNGCHRWFHTLLDMEHAYREAATPLGSHEFLDRFAAFVSVFHNANMFFTIQYVFCNTISSIIQYIFYEVVNLKSITQYIIVCDQTIILDPVP